VLGQAAADLDPDPAAAEADGPAPPPIDTALSSPSVSDGASPSAKMKLQSNIDSMKSNMDSVKKKVNIDSMKSNMDSMKKKVQGHRDKVKAAMKRRGEIMRQELVLQRE
jgi:hypothetical protein